MNGLKTLLLASISLPCFTGSAPAQDYNIGLAAYARGDFEAAIAEWLPLAKLGEPNAQYKLGKMYRQGQGVSQDYLEALRWFILASEQGEPNAQTDLGTMYHSGEGVPQDYTEAAHWLLLAAEQGQPDAQYNPPYCIDSVKASQWILLRPCAGIFWLQSKDSRMPNSTSV